MFQTDDFNINNVKPILQQSANFQNQSDNHVGMKKSNTERNNSSSELKTDSEFKSDKQIIQGLN